MQCIESVKLYSDKIDYEFIVVDNCSKDNSKHSVLTKHPDVKWLDSKENIGFGRANNMGVKNASSNYILLLNSDIIIVNKAIEDCLEYLIHNKIGVIGPKLIYPNGDIQKSTYGYIGDFNEILKENLILDKLFTFSEPQYRAIMGAFMMMKKETFDSVNGFDEDFFMYCEELDLCKRIVKSGESIYYHDSLKVIHIHGASSNSNWVLRQSLLSRSLLVLKHKGVFTFYLSQFIYISNFITNFIFMWFIDEKYRGSQLNYFKQYISIIGSILKIPFNYKRTLNSNDNYLKAT